MNCCLCKDTPLTLYTSLYPYLTTQKNLRSEYLVARFVCTWYNIPVGAEVKQDENIVSI